MEQQLEHPIEKYLRKPFRNPFCAGCGEPQVLYATLRAVDELNLDADKVPILVGIGCFIQFRSMVNMDVGSTLHGRTIPFATGLKLIKPELKPIILTGDGDAASIGGNHLIHAARRNVDITVIVLNNGSYANTGGQMACTTPLKAHTTTSPYGCVEQPFDLCKLVEGAGASYVARWSTVHLTQLTKSIKEAINKKGFAFIECLAQCPVLYGRYNKMPAAVDMIRWYKRICVTKSQAEKMSEDELKDKIVVGKFVDRDRPEFTEEIRKLNQLTRGA